MENWFGKKIVYLDDFIYSMSPFILHVDINQNIFFFCSKYIIKALFFLFYWDTGGTYHTMLVFNKNQTLCANIKVNEIAVFFYYFFSIFSGFAIWVVLVICFWLINSIKV